MRGSEGAPVRGRCKHPGRMALRVGIDLVEVEAVRAALAAHGDAYLRRVYTEAEASDVHADPQGLAARFAAKEAALKALRAGREAVPPTDIEVRREDDGDPTLVLHGRAAELAERLGVEDIQVSLTHERSHAAAVVVMQVSEADRQS